MAPKNHLSKNVVILLTVFVLIPFFAISGFVVGFKIYESPLDQPNTWVDLGSPPTEIEHLLVADTTTIYVRTVDGKIFSCYRESYYDQDCCQERVSSPTVWEDNSFCPPPANMPQVPGGVVARLDNRHCITSPVHEGNHWFSYILLSNGSVMQWISGPISWFGPANQSNQFVLKVCGGGIIGLLVGLAIHQHTLRIISRQ